MKTLAEINSQLYVKNHESEELASVIKKYSSKEYGEVSINEDGVKYRHDSYTSSYKNTPMWLKKLFESAANASGRKHETQFRDGAYSFSFDRAKFKGRPHGKIYMSELVILGVGYK